MFDILAILYFLGSTQGAMYSQIIKVIILKTTLFCIGWFNDYYTLFMWKRLRGVLLPTVKLISNTTLSVSVSGIKGIVRVATIRRTEHRALIHPIEVKDKKKNRQPNVVCHMFITYGIFKHQASGPQAGEHKDD
jgi:hypothetical protein